MRSRVTCLVALVCACMYVCMYVCVYVYVDKKRAVWGLTTRKSPVNVIYCLLIEFNGQKKGLTMPGDSFWEGTKPHLVYM